jgi:hypothetical protein
MPVEIQYREAPVLLVVGKDGKGEILNVQPTIKVTAGYKFTVRVNRDILFESLYEPVDPRQ